MGGLGGGRVLGRGIGIFLGMNSLVGIFLGGGYLLVYIHNMMIENKLIFLNVE